MASVRAAATLIVLFTAAPLVAATMTWTGGASDGRWVTAANWSPASVPAAGDIAVLPSTPTTIIIEGSISVASVQLGGPLTLHAFDSTLCATITGEASAPVVKSGPGELTLCAGEAPNTFDGPFEIVQGTVRGGATVFGSVAGATTVRAGTALFLTAPTAEPLVVDGGMVDAGGIFGPAMALGSVTLTADSMLVGAYSGAISGPGRIVPLPSFGRIRLEGGPHTFAGPLHMSSGGDVRLMNAEMPDIDVEVIGLRGSGATFGGAVIRDSTLGSLLVQDAQIAYRAEFPPAAEPARAIVTKSIAVPSSALVIDATFPTVFSARGSVNVSDAVLHLNWSGAAGQTLTLVENDESDPVTGRFLWHTIRRAGAGPLVPVKNGSLYIFGGLDLWRLWYDGGDGNDIVLRAETPRRRHEHHDFYSIAESIYFRVDDTLHAYLPPDGRFVTINSAAPGYAIAAISDIDGDGLSDVILRHTATGEIGVWFAAGGGASIAALDASFSIVGSADFDGDGKWDLLLRHEPTSELGVWLMNGSAIRHAASLGSVPADFAIAATGDFDADGSADILFESTGAHQLGLWFLDGANVTGGAFVTSLPATASAAGAGDFDRDGRSDILVRSGAEGTLSILLMDGSAVAAEYSAGTMGPGKVIAQIGDFSNDAQAEILVKDNATGVYARWIPYPASGEAPDIQAAALSLSPQAEVIP